MRGVFQRDEINPIQELGMMILFWKNNVEKNALKHKTPLETEFFWVKLAALNMLKRDKKGGLYPAYNPKKLFPEFFTGEDKKADEEAQLEEDYKDVEWQTPSDAVDDWEKTQRLLAQHANMSVTDDSPTKTEASTEPFTPPEGVGENLGPPTAPEFDFSADDAEWL